MTDRRRVPRSGGDRRLTLRERQIVTALCAGKSPKQIAKDYRVSVSTVRVHIRTIARDRLPLEYFGISPIQAILLWKPSA